MPLTVTPGGPNDDAYAVLVEIKARWDEIGFDYSSYTDSQIEQAARRATAWLDGEFGRRFPGAPLNGRSQSLCWPRTGAEDIDGNTIDGTTIPAEIERAMIEATQREVITPNCLTPDYVRSQQVKRAKAGPADVEYHAGVGDFSDVKPFLASVEHALSRMLTSRFATGLMAV